jgi:hypothetical protein
VSAWSFARYLALAALISGCAAEYDHTDLNNVHAPPKPLDGRVTYARINVSVGAIVTARIVSYDDDHKEPATDMRTKDTSVVEVTGVVSPGDYAFLGLRPGQTEVEVLADGKVVLILTAVVTEQPTPP